MFDPKTQGLGSHPQGGVVVKDRLQQLIEGHVTTITTQKNYLLTRFQMHAAADKSSADVFGKTRQMKGQREEA